jgi:hypothetical protein
MNIKWAIEMYKTILLTQAAYIPMLIDRTPLAMIAAKAYEEFKNT